MEKGDKLKGKKIVGIKYFDNEHSKTTEKLFILEDASEWMLSDEGLHKVGKSEVK